VGRGMEPSMGGIRNVKRMVGGVFDQVCHARPVCYSALCAPLRWPLGKQQSVDLEVSMTSKSSENAVNTLQVEGACHCGSIRFKALVDPRKVMVCHCSGCQHL